MKKFFSLIALVAVFAACKPEDLSTAFSVRPATATINVKVMSAVDGDVSESGFTTKNIPELTKNDVGTIVEQDVTVSATYKGATGTATIKVGPVLAGGDAVYNAVVYIPGVAGDYEYKVEDDGDATVAESLQYLEASKLSHGGHSYSHDGQTNWIENASEYVQSGTATWTSYTGFTVDNVVYVNENLKSVVDMLIPEDTETTSTESLKFDVSAWSLYNVFGTVTTTTQPKKVVAVPQVAGIPDLGTVGTFNLVTKAVKAEYKEVAHPSHSSHYVHGHGTHGSGNNAGGGLVDAE